VSLVRPVLTREAALAVCHKVIDWSTADGVTAELEHRAFGVTRVNRAHGHSATDRSTLNLTISVRFGAKATTRVSINQVDDATLKTAVAYAERTAKQTLGAPQLLSQPTINERPRPVAPTALWHEGSVDALLESRSAVLPAILDRVRAARLGSSIFVGASARAQCYVEKGGASVFGEETDTELTVTCWTPDFRGSGWGGQAARDWRALDAARVTEHAVDLTRRSMQTYALEPGRRTAILGPAAVAQLVRPMAYAFDAMSTIEHQRTPFSLPPHGSKLGLRVFDPRITMQSDPADVEGGYLPFFGDGYPLVPMTWVRGGVLENLAYAPGYGASRGKMPYAQVPYSVRLGGGTSTLEEMIANCKEGVYVNRFSGVTIKDDRTGVMSGTTRDGCFLVRNGVIDRAIRNFRFLESPWFVFNRIEMIGEPRRAALGYTPDGEAWPLPPIIVPPIMVRDFNFSALADAV